MYLFGLSLAAALLTTFLERPECVEDCYLRALAQFIDIGIASALRLSPRRGASRAIGCEAIVGLGGVKNCRGWARKKGFLSVTAVAPFSYARISLDDLFR